MTGRGRGRGRPVVTTTPGGLSQKSKPADDDWGSWGDPTNNSSNSEVLVKAFKELLVSAENDHSAIYNLVKNMTTSKVQLEETAKTIYTECIKHRNFCKHGVEICSSLSNVDVDNCSFRSELLKIVHKDFKDKDLFRVDNREKYLACCVFLSQMFSIMRTKDGQHFRPLCTPIYDYFELLLSPEAGDEEVACSTTQLQDIGMLLEKYDANKMKELCNLIRTKILDETTSCKARCILLETLELHANNWESLPHDVSTFYKEFSF